MTKHLGSLDILGTTILATFPTSPRRHIGNVGILGTTPLVTQLLVAYACTIVTSLMAYAPSRHLSWRMHRLGSLGA